MTPTNTTITFSQVYNDFKDALKGAADALKTGSEHVYEVLVQQQIVNSITYLIMLILGIIGIIVFYKGAKNKNEIWYIDEGRDGGPTGMLFMRTITLIIGVILLGYTLSNLQELITGFMNPEYGAIQEIKSFIR